MKDKNQATIGIVVMPYHSQCHKPDLYSLYLHIFVFTEN